MTTFEKLPLKHKDAVRASDQWPDIAKYFNKLSHVIQHNVMVYARMMIGGRAHGIVPYWGGNFINPIHRPIGGDNTPCWHKDPNRAYWHKPQCPYAIGGFLESQACTCRDRVALRKAV